MKFPVSKPSISEVEHHLINSALRETRLSQGVGVAQFERTLANYLDVDHVIATTSGTTALHLALAALGIGPGDEVLVPDMTFVATANAVAYTGARPVLVDVDAQSWCIDPADVARKITPRTRAIVPVHLYGVACDMHALEAYDDLLIIEDAAEGFTGSYFGAKLGTLSDAGVFSFYGNKVITCGEGGAICTDNPALYQRLHFLRGQALDPTRRYYHPEIGFNYRMTDLQAAIGTGQMYRLEGMLWRRREIFATYTSRLCYHVGVVPDAPQHSRTAPWIFTLQLNPHVSRERLMSRLDAEGIETRPGFVPLHRLPMYQLPDEQFPVTTAMADRIISLPTYPDLTTDEVHTICDAIERILSEST